MDLSKMKVETLAVHGGERRPGPEGSLVFPIYQGTVYTVEPGTGYHDIKYIRLFQPTRPQGARLRRQDIAALCMCVSTRARAVRDSAPYTKGS